MSEIAGIVGKRTGEVAAGTVKGIFSSFLDSTLILLGVRVPKRSTRCYSRFQFGIVNTVILLNLFFYIGCIGIFYTQISDSDSSKNNIRMMSITGTCITLVLFLIFHLDASWAYTTRNGQTGGQKWALYGMLLLILASIAVASIISYYASLPESGSSHSETMKDIFGYGLLTINIILLIIWFVIINRVEIIDKDTCEGNRESWKHGQAAGNVLRNTGQAAAAVARDIDHNTKVIHGQTENGFNAYKKVNREMDKAQGPQEELIILNQALANGDITDLHHLDGLKNLEEKYGGTPVEGDIAEIANEIEPYVLAEARAGVGARANPPQPGKPMKILSEQEKADRLAESRKKSTEAQLEIDNSRTGSLNPFKKWTKPEEALKKRAEAEVETRKLYDTPTQENLVKAEDVINETTDGQELGDGLLDMLATSETGMAESQNQRSKTIANQAKNIEDQILIYKTMLNFYDTGKPKQWIYEIWKEAAEDKAGVQFSPDSEKETLELRDLYKKCEDKLSSKTFFTKMKNFANKKKGNKAPPETFEDKEGNVFIVDTKSCKDVIDKIRAKVKVLEYESEQQEKELSNTLDKSSGTGTNYASSPEGVKRYERFLAEEEEARREAAAAAAAKAAAAPQTVFAKGIAGNFSKRHTSLSPIRLKDPRKGKKKK